MRSLSTQNAVQRFFLDFLLYAALFAVAFWRAPTEARILGSMLAIPSFALWFLARRQLGQSFTFSAQASELVTRGLYSKIRHPIYLFSTLALLGTALCLSNPYFYIYVALVTIVQGWRAKREECVLQARFGEDYINYKRRTWF